MNKDEMIIKYSDEHKQYVVLYNNAVMMKGKHASVLAKKLYRWLISQGR